MNNIVECPHCGQPWEIAAINCGVFICGAVAAGAGAFAQVPPHDEAGAVRLKAAAGTAGFVGCALQFTARRAPGALAVAKCTGK